MYVFNEKHCLIIVFLLVFSGVSGQTRWVFDGNVIDAETKLPIPGVTISTGNLTKGTFTKVDGTFRLENLVKAKYIVTFSYLGYRGHRITIERSKKSAVVVIELKERLELISEIAIHGKSKSRKLKEQAIPVSIITVDEIPGSVSNVIDLLNKTSGIKIRNTGGTGSDSRISVRGLEGRRIGFFIDETPLGDNSDFIGLNDIPVHMIERIEIYKGIVPAKLGGSAIGGAINIVLKEYPPKYSDVSYYIGSYNTHNASTILKLNDSLRGFEIGAGGFYTYAENDYTMESPINSGVFIKRDWFRFYCEKMVVR